MKMTLSSELATACARYQHAQTGLALVSVAMNLSEEHVDNFVELVQQVSKSGPDGLVAQDVTDG
jgi:collagenase-like PrtC family protease